MRLYADTSWWLACKCRHDTQHVLDVAQFDGQPGESNRGHLLRESLYGDSVMRPDFTPAPLPR